MVGHVEWVDFLRVARFPERGSVTAAEDRVRPRRWRRGGRRSGDGRARGGGGLLLCARARRQRGDRSGRAQRSRRHRSGGVARRPHPPGRHAARTRWGAHDHHARRAAGAAWPPIPWTGIGSNGRPASTSRPATRERCSRRGAARTLVATPRARDGLHDSGGHASTPSCTAPETVTSWSWSRRMRERARLMVETEGAAGGRWWGESEGRWPAVATPGEPRDDYGCGDAFAAGFTVGLAAGLTPLGGGRDRCAAGGRDAHPVRRALRPGRAGRPQPARSVRLRRRTYVRVPRRPDRPPRRPRCLLRLGRAARRSGAAGPAGDRRRRRRARGQLRGEGPGRADGDGWGAGAPALPRGGRGATPHVGLHAGQPCGVRGVRTVLARRRGAVDRRGVPRRPGTGAHHRLTARDRGGAACPGARTGRAWRSPSDWRERNSWPRWPAGWPSPTVC